MKNAWIHAALCAALIAGVSGCHSKSVNAQSGSDPAAGNLAQPGTENEAQQQAEQYSGSQAGQQAPAPIERAYSQQSAPPPGYENAEAYPGDQSYGEGDDQYAPIYDDSLTDEEATEPPPPLPDYDQPPAPDPDYIWTPGYWAWGPYGYYWVPGCWVEAPYVGALWTPGYWGYVGGRYRFHHGYWARHIGFYGGIDYGFGYFGVGYEGGYWNGPHFYYNTVITHVDRDRVRDVYVHNVTVNRGGARVSFNGGRGGLQVRPRPAEISAMREQRYAPMQSQVQIRDQASRNRQQFYSANHGRPAEAVAARPVTSEHRMPSEMPRVAVRPEARGGAGGAQQNPGNGRPETARPGQVQQGRPDFRTQQQNGRPDFQQRQQQPQAQPQPQPQQQQQRDLRGQPGRPDSQQRQQQPQAQPQPQPQQQQQRDFRGQQGRPDFQQRQQPQLRQQAPPQPQAQPQPQPQQQQQRDFRGQQGQGRPDFQQRQQQMRQQAPPQPQAQPRPQEQMRQQGPPPQAQRPQPQAAPQQRAPQAHQQGPPQQQHQGGGQPHDNGHGHDGGGDGRDRR